MNSLFSKLSPQPLTYPCHRVQELSRPIPLWKRFGTSSIRSNARGPFSRDSELARLEGMLFAASEPLSIRRLTTLLKWSSAEETRRQLKRLAALYHQESSALQLVELAGEYQLRTREAFLPWLLKLQPAPAIHLSNAARETLTMIAYRQPINRADLEALRGVSCIDVLRVLLEKGLIRIAGRDKSLGRPVQYGTTKTFLQYMGLKSLNDLPPLKD